MPLAGGALCGGCRRYVARKATPEVGSIGRAIAARRAGVLLEMTAERDPAQAETLSTTAAEQLAAAWGVKLKRGDA